MHLGAEGRLLASFSPHGHVLFFRSERDHNSEIYLIGFPLDDSRLDLRLHLR